MSFNERSFGGLPTQSDRYIEMRDEIATLRKRAEAAEAKLEAAERINKQLTDFLDTPIPTVSLSHVIQQSEENARLRVALEALVYWDKSIMDVFLPGLEREQWQEILDDADKALNPREEKHGDSGI